MRVSPDEGAFVASVNRALRRARFIAIAEAAAWGIAAAPISRVSGFVVLLSVALLRLPRR